jgi:dTDP-4-amino-4,6-dideoxygalactose transaminase
VSHVNAKPVFVDCEKDTWNVDISAIEKGISPNTKAIIGVHLYGQPFDFDAAKKIADKHNLTVLEDSAQAHGAKYKGRPAGSLGKLGCFSFYPGKNLGAYGEGGAITTNNQELAEKLRMLRNLGQSEKYVHDIIGYNLRMHGLQGAVLNVKLKYLEEWNVRRKEIASQYQQGISNKKVQCQHQPDWADSVYHLFVITVDDREQMMLHLKSKGINPGIHNPIPCHLQKAYSHLEHSKGDFPNTEYLADHCLSLPMYPELTNAEVNRVIQAVNDYNY